MSSATPPAIKVDPLGAKIKRSLHRLLNIKDVVVLGFQDLLCSRRHVRMPLPVELVVHPTRKEYQSCDVARAFETRWYHLKADNSAETVVLHYDQLHSLPGFKGTNDYTEILMAERWVDYGPDGHCEFEMMGWMLILDTETEWPTCRFGVGSGEWPKVEQAGEGIG